MSDLVDPDHFQELDGVITPQPWMQWRHVATIDAPNRAAAFGATIVGGGGVDVFGSLGQVFGSMVGSITSLFGFGSPLAGLATGSSAAGNKNQLIHSIQRSWQNNTPVDQYVYGMVTRGGCRVTLQARSRGGLAVRTGARTAWVGHTDFDNGKVGHWPLNSRVSLAEVADVWTLRFSPGVGVAQSVIPMVPVGPDDRVTIKFRARRDADYNGTNAAARMRVSDQADTTISSLWLDTSVLVNPNVWYDRELTYIVPKTAGAPTGLVFALASNATAGNLYVDDIAIDIVRGGGNATEIPLVDASMFGIGGDVGRGGVIALGTDFANLSQQMQSVTFPLQPERAGWVKLTPGEVFTARVEVRFVSEYWEATTIDGGDSGTESSFESGETRLDLYAVPFIPDPRPNAIP